MYTVNMHEAKTKLSLLVNKALLGEDIVIAKAGTPLVKLVPVSIDERPRVLGGYENQIWIAPDFDETPDEVISAFEGED